MNRCLLFPQSKKHDTNNHDDLEDLRNFIYIHLECGSLMVDLLQSGDWKSGCTTVAPIAG